MHEIPLRFHRHAFIFQPLVERKKEDFYFHSKTARKMKHRFHPYILIMIFVWVFIFVTPPAKGKHSFH